MISSNLSSVEFGQRHFAELLKPVALLQRKKHHVKLHFKMSVCTHEYTAPSNLTLV